MRWRRRRKLCEVAAPRNADERGVAWVRAQHAEHVGDRAVAAQHGAARKPHRQGLARLLVVDHLRAK
eukprot:6208657-Pleurochrysis_carterae.AAC.2